MTVVDPSQYLGTVTSAVGALDTVVDGMKLVPWIELAGFERLFSGGGVAGGRMWPTRTKAGLDPLSPALRTAYGNDAMDLLKTHERDVIARGIFTSVADLKRKLMRYIRQYNRTPKPVKWVYRNPAHRITTDSHVTVH